MRTDVDITKFTDLYDNFIFSIVEYYRKFQVSALKFDSLRYFEVND